MPQLPISTKISTISASRPEISEIRFIYNYYLPDEAGNDLMDEQGGFMLTEEAALEYETAKDFSTSIPRTVSITIQPGQFLGVTPVAAVQSLLADGKLDDFLMKDIDLSYPNALGTRIGDGEILGRIAKLSKHSYQVTTRGKRTTKISRIKRNLDRAFNLDKTSLDIVEDCLKASTPIAPTKGGAGGYASKLGKAPSSRSKVNFLPDLPSESKYIKSAGFSVDLKVATNIYDILLSQGLNFTSTPLTQFILTNFTKLTEMSKNAPFTDDSNYTNPLIPLSFERVESGQYEEPVYVNAGMILQKYEITERGLQHVEDSFYPVTEENNIFNAYDPNIKYGTTYAYGLRELYLVTATVSTELPNLGPGVYKTNFLIEGSQSALKYISCYEKTAPRPPEAVFIRRGVNAKGIMVQWQFPSNPQRDIKKFQIFRRKNIKEPFYLIKELDFNDADPVVAPQESIEERLIKKIEFPQTAYNDNEFRREDKFIYAVCSIDAHGYSSVLSAQLEASIDYFSNNIKIRTVSPAGAPKQYPNMYITATDSQNIDKVRLTEDVVKTSGFDQVDVYFTPEARKIQMPGGEGRDVYKLARSANSDVDTINPNPKFVLQFINTDNGKAQNISILIRDVRQNKIPLE